MNTSFRLGLLHRRLLETSAIFRHQSRQAEEIYGEASHSWRDRRGAAFALGFLEPQLHLVPPVVASLVELSSIVEETEGATALAEAGIAAVHGATEEIETTAQASLRDAIHADHLAADAASRAQKVELVAQDVQRRTLTLGDPPI